jgi:hypothetical protein
LIDREKARWTPNFHFAAKPLPLMAGKSSQVECSFPIIQRAANAKQAKTMHLNKKAFKVSVPIDKSQITTHPSQ